MSELELLLEEQYKAQELEQEIKFQINLFKKVRNAEAVAEAEENLKSIHVLQDRILSLKERMLGR